MKTVLTALALTFPVAAFAHPLDGNYALDFYASSGSCVTDVFVNTTSSVFETNIKPLQRTDYRLGAFCHDRSTNDVPPRAPEDCFTHIEENVLGSQRFESTWTSPAARGASSGREVDSRLTISVIADDRIQADLVAYAREVAKPIFRCVYVRQ